MPTSKRSWVAISTFGFALAVGIGLVGAWIGLEKNSYWVDELFTRWVVTGDGGSDGLFARLATDVHPPLYYTLLFGYSRLVGTSDVALRSFSALCACLGVGVFVLWTGRAFSLPARLFAAAIATTSDFWFYQSQNTRDYSLSMLLGAVILSLSLRILGEEQAGRPPRWTWAWLLVVMLIGAMTHFYMMFLAVTVLGILFMFLPNRRIPTALGAVMLVLIGLIYTKTVIAPYSQFSLTENWIRNDVHWNQSAVLAAIRQSFNPISLVALILCGALAVWRLQAMRSTDHRFSAVMSWTKANPAVVLCLTLPLLIAVEGMVSSAVVSPNVTDRNLLVCSPFIWGLFALLFDGAFGDAQDPFSGLAKILVTALVLASCTVVLGRNLPRNEPYKESAAWIKAQPACRGAEIPVLNTSTVSWANRAFTDRVTVYEYNHYLDGFARPRNLALEDVLAGHLPEDLKVELARRLHGQGCPIIAWSSHSFFVEQARAAALAISHATAAGDSQASPISIKGFKVFKFRLRWTARTSPTYVLYVDRAGEPKLAD